MNLEDPRSRIVLHMNWKGQALPVLLNGLPSKAQLQSPSKESTYYSLPIPSKEDIVSISPASQIRMGNYHVPTFLIHGMHTIVPPNQKVFHADMRIVFRHQRRLDPLATDSTDVREPLCAWCACRRSHLRGQGPSL